MRELKNWEAILPNLFVYKISEFFWYEIHAEVLRSDRKPEDSLGTLYLGRMYITTDSDVKVTELFRLTTLAKNIQECMDEADNNLKNWLKYNKEDTLCYGSRIKRVPTQSD